MPISSFLKKCSLFVLIGVIACSPKPKAERRLELSGTVEASAVARFVAAEYFREGNNDPNVPTYDNKRPMILLVVDEFKNNLLGKVETDVPATTLNIHRVVIIGKGDLLIKELGDEAETKLAYVWELLARQPSQSNGDGVLYAERQSAPFIQNVFFIRGTDGNLWAVTVYWAESHSSEADNYGWVINAEPTSQPWDNDVRVFSLK